MTERKMNIVKRSSFFFIYVARVGIWMGRFLKLEFAKGR